MSRLSIVIPIYNNSKQAVRCVNSIYKFIELDENNYEIILVDDFSDREDFINLESNIKKLNKRNIIIKKNKENCGPAKTRNVGASLTKFENILFLANQNKDVSFLVIGGSDKQINYYKIGKNVRFNLNEVNDWLSNHKK